MKRWIRINSRDNVAVVLDPQGLFADNSIAEDDIAVTVKEHIPPGHKFALRNIRRGEQIIKYGHPIGTATTGIKAGEWVHTHNLATTLGDNLSYTYTPQAAPIVHAQDNISVDAYLRFDGRMGVRNELWILPTVGCVNAQAEAVAAAVRERFDISGIDDVRAFTHNYGCSQLGEDHANTRAAIAALACHPNAGGVLVMGLGCENNRIGGIEEAMTGYDRSRVRFLVAQNVDDEIEEGTRLCGQLLERMRSDRRQALPVSMLRVGLKCGGSDGLSGITANPLVGLFSDWLISHGGTTVLTEVPEMFGAETILMNRATAPGVFDKTVRLINSFKDYFRLCGQPVYENPSPGNKDGGITTLEEKSLGCVQKSGAMPVADVLDYACPISTDGLNLLRAPGNDLVAATALALSGCQIILFTTGRGTPFGTCVPTLKIATNSTIAARKSRWIDFNAGNIAEGESPETVLHRLIDKVLATAAGEPSRNEEAGAKGIAIFKTGVTL